MTYLLTIDLLFFEHRRYQAAGQCKAAQRNDTEKPSSRISGISSIRMQVTTSGTKKCPLILCRPTTSPFRWEDM